MGKPRQSSINLATLAANTFTGLQQFNAGLQVNIGNGFFQNNVTVVGDLTLDAKFLTLGGTNSITASTTQTQGQQPLVSSFNRVTVVANPNDVVTLPTPAFGRLVAISNTGANVLQIFPAAGHTIQGKAADASATIAAGTACLFIGQSTSSWTNGGIITPT